MAAKKQNPAVAKRIADRKAFVKDKVASKGITAKQARQRYFVQTRMAEMKAAGKTVTPEMRKQLQQKFQSGNVARKGFAAPKKKGSGSSSVTPMTPSPSKSKSGGDQPVRMGRVGKQTSYANTSSKEPRMSGTGKYGPWNPKPSVSGFPKGSSKSKPKDTRSAGQRIAEAGKVQKIVSPNTRKPAKPSASKKMMLY
jgi:hypothetical protein